jgi:beta-lactamase superfamily II metal-dependent hydrolase
MSGSAPLRISSCYRDLRLIAGVASTLAALVFMACSSDNGTAPPPAPVITVTGVEDGVTYTEPVTIEISVDQGVYEATLNGQDFMSGTRVSDVGAYRLVVDGRNGEATSREEVMFGITLAGDRILIVRMLDLGPNESGGGGDAMLLTDSTSAGMFHVLIDAGPAGVDGADSTAVAQRLAEMGVDTLEALVLTHAHSDHFYGIPPVMRDVHVRRFFHNGQVRNFERYNATIAFAEATADTAFVPTTPVIRGIKDPGSPIMTVLSPFSAFLGLSGADNSMINEGSLGTLIVFGEFNMFVTGDGELEANNRWRNTFPTLTSGVDVLKVGHHGANDAIFNSGSSGASIWLDHTRPEAALVTANGISHPRQGATAELLSRGIETWCTNVHGDLVLRASSAGQYFVTAQRNEDQPCEPGSAADT